MIRATSAGTSDFMSRDSGFSREARRLSTGLTILFDPLELLVGDAAAEGDDAGGEDLRTLPLREELDALGGGVGPLVILAGQILHREDAVTRRSLIGLLIHVVDVRLREDGAARLRKLRGAQPGNIVAVEQLHVRNGLHAEVLHQIGQNVLGLDVEARFFLHKYANHVRHIFPRFRPCGHVASRTGKLTAFSLFLLFILTYCF